MILTSHSSWNVMPQTSSIGTLCLLSQLEADTCAVCRYDIWSYASPPRANQKHGKNAFKHAAERFRVGPGWRMMTMLDDQPSVKMTHLQFTLKAILYMAASANPILLHPSKIRADRPNVIWTPQVLENKHTCVPQPGTTRKQQAHHSARQQL